MERTQRKTLRRIVPAVMLLWLAVFFMDWIAVAWFERPPFFCIPNREETHYTGLGYAYDAYLHPVSGRFEYCQYVFGFDTVCTMTN